MTLAITIFRWFLAKHPQHAALALQQYRIRRERALVKAVAREMREGMKLPPLEALR